MRTAVRQLFSVIGLFATTAAFGAEPVVQARTVAVDPEILRLSVGELIDRLALETQLVVWSVGEAGRQTSAMVSRPALVGGFQPLDAAPDWARNLKQPVRSPVMVELVRRGVDSLPTLLRNLTNSRPTLLVMNSPDFGVTAFADHYDYRFSDPARQPGGVNTVGRMGEQGLGAQQSYIYKVGDLCYLAICDIVNRRPSLTAMGHVSVHNFPTRYPALAAAMGADWSGLTPRDHEASLRADALEVTPGGDRGIHSSGGLQRLLFYYPTTGREVAATLLRQVLQDDKADASRWVARAYFLMNDLAAFEWVGLDEQILAVFDQAAQLPGYDNGDLIWLCARRLAGRGLDTTLRQRLEVLIARNQHRMADPAAKPVDVRVRSELNAHLQSLVAKLPLR